MKTKKLGKKLALSKTTVANLEQNMLNAVRGGYNETEPMVGCNTWPPACPTKPQALCHSQISFCICPASDDCGIITFKC